MVSFLFVAVQGDLDARSLFLKTVIWSSSQGSVFQFVNFYVNLGVATGVLWSIATELQFYFVLFVMAAVGTRYVLSRLHASMIIVALLSVLSAVLHEWTLAHQYELLPYLFSTLYASLLINGFLFAFGVLAYLRQAKLYGLCRERLLYLLVFYDGFRVILSISGLSSTLVHTALLCLTVYPLLGLVVYLFSISWQHLSRPF